jgi:LysR family transcriptional regulator, glycine cleavage system transcriptional activator
MKTSVTPPQTSTSAPKAKMRTRALSVGHLRAFEAVARHLNFRVASEELALTQSAVSRQIQALEDEIGVSLFLRHTRSVELSCAGSQLLRAVMPSLESSADSPHRRTQNRLDFDLGIVFNPVADSAHGSFSAR